MDAGLAKAGVVMAVGLTLLVPTFNALNASYVQNVRPPPWMPTPPTPPDMTPPTDMTPPPDFTPPTDYQGPIPPGACPPPVIRALNETKRDIPIDRTAPGSDVKSFTFNVPNTTLAVGGFVNFTNWQGQSVSVLLQPPGGGKAWAPAAQSGSIVGSNPPASFKYNSTATYDPVAGKLPPPGAWKLTTSVEFALGGTIHTEFIVALACGGMGAR